MFFYIVGRLFWLIPYSWGVVTLLFFLFALSGDDPAKIIAGQRSDLQTIDNIRKELGLDLPLSDQYILYLNDLSPIGLLDSVQRQSGNYQFVSLSLTSKNKAWVLKLPYLRRSFQNNRPVASLYFEKLPGTILLTLAALTFASILGIAMGIWSAIHRHSKMDKMVEIIALLGLSTPSYVAAIVMAWLLGLVLHEYTGLNVSGYIVHQNIWDGENIYDWSFLILPAFTLGLRPLAIIFQLTRQSMVEVITSDYIRTAKAKGLAQPVIYFKHALRNALNPVVTSLSVWFGTLLTGAFFIEYIFNWEGVGKLTVEALITRDYPMLLGSSIYTAMIFVLTSLLADIVNAFLDPRLKYA